MDFNFSQFDLEETPIETALEDAETLPFMGERRLVFMQNPFFLTAEKTKSKVEHNVKRLEAYLADPVPYSIVVLTAPYPKLDERKKITKELKRRAEVIEAKKLGEHELRSWINERAAVSGTQMDADAVDLLIELAGTNLMMLTNELESSWPNLSSKTSLPWSTIFSSETCSMRFRSTMNSFAKTRSQSKSSV